MPEDKLYADLLGPCLLISDPFRLAVMSMCSFTLKHAGMARLWRPQPERQALLVRSKVCMLGLDKDIFVAAVYIPPAGSGQLQKRSLASRTHGLRQSALRAWQQGYVLLGGDFNAKVSTLLDVVDDAQQFIQHSGVPCNGSLPSPQVNVHGQLHVDSCHNPSLVLRLGRPHITGRGPEGLANPCEWKGSSPGWMAC